MSPVALSQLAVLTAALFAPLALAQGPPASPTITPAPTAPPAPNPAVSTFPATPLASKGPFQLNALPYKVDTDVGLIRGDQWGYNICNSTTEGPTSLCQTAHVNSLDDFCLWGPPELGKPVGDIEGIMVAWCSKRGHGTRLIPAGALTGVQLTKTPDYIQVVGYFNQEAINILADDMGGEMDPHGADLRGNPMGGVMFSNAWGEPPKQAIEWHNFVGAKKFCMKLCDPARPDDAHYCEHILDRIGTDYNCPSNAKDGVFESCDGESQDFPGVYTVDGVVSTYTQPAGPITTIGYSPRIPASSNCRQFESTSLYAGLPSGTASVAAPSSSARPTGVTTNRGGTAAGASTSANGPAPTSGAAQLGVSSVAALAGLVFSIIFLS